MRENSLSICIELRSVYFLVVSDFMPVFLWFGFGACIDYGNVM